MHACVSGGGTALLLALALHKSKEISDDVKIETYAFGSPPVFSPLRKVPREVSQNTWCFINECDLVPRMSLAQASKLFWVIRRVSELPLQPQHYILYLASHHLKRDLTSSDTNSDKTAGSKSNGVGQLFSFLQGDNKPKQIEEISNDEQHTVDLKDDTNNSNNNTNNNNNSNSNNNNNAVSKTSVFTSIRQLAQQGETVINQLDAISKGGKEQENFLQEAGVFLGQGLDQLFGQVNGAQQYDTATVAKIIEDTVWKANVEPDTSKVHQSL
jgi:Lipase (class 3)